MTTNLSSTRKPRQQAERRLIRQGTGVASVALIGTMAAAFGVAETRDETPVQSFIPQEKTAEFVVASLDLASFRNSFGPKRNPGQHHFADFGLKASSITASEAVIDTEAWHYEVRILSRGDLNKDGVEDLLIRFVDEGKGDANYRASDRYVVTRYSETGRLIAIAYTPNPE